VDKNYCSEQFKRMLKTLNIIHKIQNLDEYRGFYEWLNQFYENEIRELVIDFTFELSNKNMLQQEHNVDDFIENYIFDRIQYGKHQVNRGTESLLIKSVGNDLFYGKVDELRQKFREELENQQQYKNAYLKLTSFIDIRCLVTNLPDSECLFLVWFSITNYFSEVETSQQNFDVEACVRARKFEQQIYNFLNDYEYLAKNRGYRLGFLKVDDMALFESETRSYEYLSLHLAKNIDIPIVDVLIGYLEFVKSALNDELLFSSVSQEQASRLDQLTKIIQTLNTQEKNQKTSLKGAGITMLLCHTIYKMKAKSLGIQNDKDVYQSIKIIFDYLAEILKCMKIKHAYNATEASKSKLELVVYATEFNGIDDLFALYGFYNSRHMPSDKLFERREVINNIDTRPKCLEQNEEKLDHFEKAVSVKPVHNIELFTLKANQLYQLIHADKKIPLNLDCLFESE